MHAFLQGVVDPAYAGKIADDDLYRHPDHSSSKAHEKLADLAVPTVKEYHHGLGGAALLDNALSSNATDDQVWESTSDPTV